MIIHHSLKILEQLSKIEELIQKVEKLADAHGIEGNREELLKKLMGRELKVPAKKD